MATRAGSFDVTSGVNRNIGSTKITNHSPVSGPVIRSPSCATGSSPNSPVVGSAARKPSVRMRLSRPPM